MKFSEFNLPEKIIEAIDFMGFQTATKIQEMAIPTIINGKDLIGCAQTGTGKTAAFLIPLLAKINENKSTGVKALVIVPTRELAQQIDEHFEALSYFLDIGSVAVYGGNQPELFNRQKKAIQNGVDVIIATPGRLIAHLNLGYLSLKSVDTLILDEADRMLEMGFIGDIIKIIGYLPEKRQNLMFSATMKADIRKLAHQVLHEPEQINIAVSKPAEGLVQQAFMVYENSKPDFLLYLIKNLEITNMVVFVSRKVKVDEVHRHLVKAGIKCEAMHSGKEQDQRNEVIRHFRAGNFKILIATDVMSRGIDIDGISHVVNYDIPDDPADYVHRVGRTARAERTGAAITLINETKDQLYFYNIEELIEKKLEKNSIPEAVGSSPDYNPEKFLRKPKQGNFNKKQKSFHKKSR